MMGCIVATVGNASAVAVDSRVAVAACVAVAWAVAVDSLVAVAGLVAVAALVAVLVSPRLAVACGIVVANTVVGCCAIMAVGTAADGGAPNVQPLHDKTSAQTATNTQLRLNFMLRVWRIFCTAWFIDVVCPVNIVWNAFSTAE